MTHKISVEKRLQCRGLPPSQECHPVLLIATAASTLISKATKEISIFGYYLCLIKETYNCSHNQMASDWFLKTTSGLK